ncbi:hypothetical protein HYS31_02945 [Candidatus Woesearchaeota archaeon]|nr:hypothetical protein [Candidatus Woesearchaeota archaeon]
MYHAKLWDEDKLNIHSSSNYGSQKYGNIFSEGKKDDAKYNEQKYGQKEGNLSSDYLKKEEGKEKEEEKKEDFFSSLEEEKKEEKHDEELTFKAARQIFSENRHEEAKKPEKKKDISTIDDAIQKAIKSEKEVIMMDS